MQSQRLHKLPQAGFLQGVTMKKIKSFFFTAIALLAIFSFTSCWFTKTNGDDEEKQTYDTSVANADALTLEEGTYDLKRVATYSWDTDNDFIYTENIEVTVSGDSITEITISTAEDYLSETDYNTDKETYKDDDSYTCDDEDFIITHTYNDLEKNTSKQTFTLAAYKAILFADKGSTPKNDVEYSDIKVNQSKDKKTITRKAKATEYSKGQSSANGNESTNTYHSEWTYTKR